jgi:hypothetical protein
VSAIARRFRTRGFPLRPGKLALLARPLVGFRRIRAAGSGTARGRGLLEGTLAVERPEATLLHAVVRDEHVQFRFRPFTRVPSFCFQSVSRSKICSFVASVPTTSRIEASKASAFAFNSFMETLPPWPSL